LALQTQILARITEAALRVHRVAEGHPNQDNRNPQNVRHLIGNRFQRCFVHASISSAMQ
jgi:hypothetical protein